MTDYGYDLNTTTKDLRILSVVYGGQPKLCIKCHMDGIIPSAGTKQWSCTSTDLFKDKVDESEMLLSGKVKTGCVNVLLLSLYAVVCINLVHV